MLQLAILDEAARSHPEVWWWVKGDGCDVTSGLQESVDHKWSGDVDLGNGKVQALFIEYTDRQKFISNIGLGDCEARWTGLSAMIVTSCYSKLNLIYVTSEQVR